MIYDLYLLAEYFPKEQAIIDAAQAYRDYPAETMAMALSLGLVRLSAKQFFFMTDKGREFVETNGMLRVVKEVSRRPQSTTGP